MTNAQKKPKIIDRIIGLIESTARRLRDGQELQDARLSAIEERVSRLDQGDNAAAARRMALSNVNLDRGSAGRDLLSMTVSQDDKAEIRWIR